MKNLFLAIILCISFNLLQSQTNANISGRIDNLNSMESIYLGSEEWLAPLKPSASGTFSIDVSISQTPSFFYLATSSKRGKIEQKTPLIWFEGDSVKITKDWSDQSFLMESLLPFQVTSEKIEALKTREQIEFILDNPINTPSLYFADKNKNKIPIGELEYFTQLINEEQQSSVYVKRIENYIAAKKRDKIKIGSKVEDFRLPNSEGNKISLIQINNKTTLIALFSSGCSYSVASIDFLTQIAETNNDKIEIITIWDDSTRETWLNTHKEQKRKITWTNLWDEFGFASTYLNRKMWPTFYVINAEGELTDIIKGYSKKTASKLKALVE